MKKLKALSFFSGALGMDIGLARAGIDVVLACESEKFIRETIRLNRPNLKIIEDINKYSSSEIKKLSGLKKNAKVDLIVGGPLCQAFSTAGKRLSIKESRGQVFLKFLEVIKDLKPKYFVIENVRGLLSVPLNKSGKKEIAKLANSIGKDLKMWDEYLANHNANVFNDSLYRLMVIVNGYADEQGKGNETARKDKNKLLSQKRAQSVADELMKQFEAQERKPELIIDVEINGRGEMLPPDMSIEAAKKNSPERRISRVSMVIGPKILLYNN